MARPSALRYQIGKNQMTDKGNRIFQVTEILQPEDIVSALRQIAIFLLGASIVSGAIYLTSGNEIWGIFSRNGIIGFGMSLILLQLVKANKTLLAAYATLFLFGFWLFSVSWDGAGVRGTVYTMLVLIVIGSGLFIGRRAGYFTALIISLSGVILLFAGRAGWLVNTERPITDIAALINTTVTFFVAAHLIRLTIDQVERALDRAQKETEERMQTDDEIRHLNAELETMVEARTVELASSNKRYQNFIENSAEGIWLLSFYKPISIELPHEKQVDLIQNTGYVAECNQALANMYGYSSREEMIGKKLLDDLYGGQATEANTQSTLKLVCEGYRSSDRLTEEVNKKGEPVYFMNNAVGEIHDGHLIGLWGVQRDITTLKKIEAERERIITELENTNNELERFTYTVSHDLKAPLITIRGFLGYLEDDIHAADQERIKSDIDRIIAATDKMQNLLDNLLELSRAGRMLNPPETILFETIAQDAVSLVTGQIEAQGVKVRIEPGLPTVFGDQIRLTQALQNLIDNAVKFMGDQPKPLIEIGQQGKNSEGDPIFYVQDNGIGIAPEHQERVFELFNKLNVEEKGTGIGLALVKRIIESHGGKIWVESDGMKKGSTFYFTIPERRKHI